MSFSSEVKEELAKEMSARRHCQIAELAAIFALNGNLVGEASINEEGEILAPENLSLQIRTENVNLARKCFTLMKRIFQITTEIEIRQTAGSAKSHTYLIRIEDGKEVRRMLMAFRLVDDAGHLLDIEEVVHPTLILNDCCRRAFIRGCFLASGSMSDPEKSYHFEVVCDTMKQASQLMERIQEFSIDARIVERKHHYVVYVKEGTQIVDLLNLMGAHVSLMNMENVRILKDMRNQVNRRVNCETANLNKTVNAAIRQMEDISYLEAIGQLEQLPLPLQEMAQLRRTYPDASLKELGELTDPPLGRSGVNHRLKKLGEIAEKARNQGGKLWSEKKSQ